MLGAVAALCIDFQFYALATWDGRTNAQFFGTVYAGLNLVALCVQLAVAPRLQARFGVGGAMMLLPLAVLGGAALVALNSTLPSRSMLKIAEGGLKASIHRSLWEQAFLPISGRSRYMAKVLVDGLMARVAESLAGVALHIVMLSIPLSSVGLEMSGVSYVIVATALLWIGLNFYIARACTSADDGDPLIRLPES